MEIVYVEAPMPVPDDNDENPIFEDFKSIFQKFQLGGACSKTLPTMEVDTARVAANQRDRRLLCEVVPTGLSVGGVCRNTAPSCPCTSLQPWACATSPLWH